jgi:hypothetical protein
MEPVSPVSTRPRWLVAVTIFLVATGFVLLAGYAWVWFSQLYLSHWPDQQATVDSGYALIPEAQQIDDLLGPAWHRTSNYTEPDVVEWQTEALFGGRYEMTMMVDLRIDRRSGRVIEILGEPRFLLLEVQEVLGSRGVNYRGAGQWEFTAEEWRQVVKAKGDFAAIGIQLDRHHPVPGFERYRGAPRNGIQMSRSADFAVPRVP